MQYETKTSPNEKYRHVINGEWDDAPESDEEMREHEHFHASEAYLQTLDNAPDPPDDFEENREKYGELTWDDISVSSDPDVVKKMATYFDGMKPDEPTDLLRAKLRLMEVDVYVNAQIAAQAELRDDAPDA